MKNAGYEVSKVILQLSGALLSFFVLFMIVSPSEAFAFRVECKNITAKGQFRSSQLRKMGHDAAMEKCASYQSESAFDRCMENGLDQYNKRERFCKKNRTGYITGTYADDSYFRGHKRTARQENTRTGNKQTASKHNETQERFDAARRCITKYTDSNGGGFKNICDIDITTIFVNKWGGCGMSSIPANKRRGYAPGQDGDVYLCFDYDLECTRLAQKKFISQCDPNGW